MDGCALAIRYFYWRNAVGRSRGLPSNS